jgi:hypothetical protein
VVEVEGNYYSDLVIIEEVFYQHAKQNNVIPIEQLEVREREEGREREGASDRNGRELEGREGREGNCGRREEGEREEESKQVRGEGAREERNCHSFPQNNNNVTHCSLR